MARFPEQFLCQKVESFAGTRRCCWTCRETVNTAEAMVSFGADETHCRPVGRLDLQLRDALEEEKLLKAQSVIEGA